MTPVSSGIVEDDRKIITKVVLIADLDHLGLANVTLGVLQLTIVGVQTFRIREGKSEMF